MTCLSCSKNPDTPSTIFLFSHMALHFSLVNLLLYGQICGCGPSTRLLICNILSLAQYQHAHNGILFTCRQNWNTVFPSLETVTPGSKFSSGYWNAETKATFFPFPQTSQSLIQANKILATHRWFPLDRWGLFWVCVCQPLLSKIYPFSVQSLCKKKSHFLPNILTWK